MVGLVGYCKPKFQDHPKVAVGAVHYMIYLSKKFKPKIGKYEEFIVKFYYDLTRGLLGLDWYDLGFSLSSSWRLEQWF